MRQQVDRKGVLPDFDVRQSLHATGDSPHDFLAGGVAQGMDDAVVAVAAFASQGQLSAGLVELGAPGDQFLDPLRGLADHLLDDRPVAQRAAGLERVADMVLEAVFGVHDAGDAALGVGAVRYGESILGDHQHRQPRIDGQGRPQAGQAAADDQHVGEEVRHMFGMERNEITGRDSGHAGVDAVGRIGV